MVSRPHCDTLALATGDLVRIPLILALFLWGCTSDETDPSDTETSDTSDSGDSGDSGDTGDTGDSGGSGTPSLPEVTCDPLPAVTSGVCDVAAGTSGMAIQGNVLGHDAVYLGGSVVLDDQGDITCVGCDCTLGTETVVTCTDAVVSPGLINPHDHIGFSENAPLPQQTKRYDHRHEWRAELSTPSNPHATPGRQWTELRQVIAGTTSMIGSGVTGGMLRNLDRVSGLESDKLTVVNNETFPLGDSNRQYKPDCTWNYALDSWETVNPGFIGHFSEGIDDYARDEFLCAADGNEGRDLTTGGSAHVHSIGLTAEGYGNMARDNTQLVWTPRSNISLYGITADILTYHRLGGRLALSTDWTYSGSMNIQRELVCAQSYNSEHLNGYFSNEDLWHMVTDHAAEAGSNDEHLGSLKAGMLGDVTVFADPNSDLFGAVVGASPDATALVIRGGEPLYGEDDTLGDLGKSCDPIQVCGETRGICVQDEFNKSLATLEGEVSGAYPLFFCDTPDDEPTCEPSRPNEFPVQGADADGDGILDDVDNCPIVFNPVRPMDAGVQQDADDDGMGDPCDPTPLATDFDNDGHDNDQDVCLLVSDDQTNTDGDEQGDACDLCPTVANVDGACPPDQGDVVTIKEIRTGSVSDGDRVTIEDAIVTAVTFAGMQVQQIDGAGVENTGLYIYNGGSRPDLDVGDEIRVFGDVGDYFGEAQISALGWEVTGSGTIAPVSVSTTVASQESYEGVLVTLTNAVADDLDYDCSVDGSSCSDDGLWTVIEDGVDVIVYDRAFDGSDTEWTNEIGTVPVTGVMTWRYNRRRITPRTTADFGP